MKNDTILDTLKPLPDGTILALSKFADDNFHVVQMVQFFFDRVENIVGTRENAG